jgi:hypothetical protein
MALSWLTVAMAANAILHLSAVGSAAQADGITLNTYTNMAFTGTPATTSVIQSTSFLIPSGGVPGSAELVGTIAFPQEGAVYHFDCR